MRMRSILLLMLLLSAGVTQAGDNLQWLCTDYDFGTFKEIEGKKTGIVKFINRGEHPTLINRVRPSCGCTGAEYREGLIAPGDTAWISFTYDPTGRPGRFEKTVKVYTGADNDLMSIVIRGTVIGEPASLRKLYPIDGDQLRLSSDFTNLGSLKKGMGRHFFINGYNLTSDTIRPSLVGLPKCFSASMGPSEVPPGDLVTFSIYYDSSKEVLPGEHEYSFKVLPNEGNSVAIDYRVKVDIHPDAATTAYSPSQEAKASIYPNFIDLGKVTKGKVKFEFSVKNSGKGSLQMQRIYCPSGEIVITSFPKRLKPGKDGIVKGYLDASKIESGGFSFSIDVITNDGDSPERRVRVSGERQ